MDLAVVPVEIPLSGDTVITPISSPVNRSRSPGRSPQSKSKHVHPANMNNVNIFEGSKLMKRTIPVGNSTFEYGNSIGEMTDSSNLYRTGKREELRQRLACDGYLFIRGAIDIDRAQKCRDRMIEHLIPKGAFKEDSNYQDACIKDLTDPGWTIDAETGGFVSDRETDAAIDGWRNVGWDPAVRDVYCGPDLKSFYSFLWGQERGAISTSDTTVSDGFQPLPDVTWLRVKGKNEVTAEHGDYYYFREATDVFSRNRHPHCRALADRFNHGQKGIACAVCLRKFLVTSKAQKAGEWHCDDCARDSYPIYTCWISLGSYTSQNSSLCIMPKSHCLTEFNKPQKGGLLPGDYPSLTKSKWGWQRGEIGQGDIILFNIKTVHGASKNTTNSYRLSIDTRVCASWVRPSALFGKENYVTYDGVSIPLVAPLADVSNEERKKAPVLKDFPSTEVITELNTRAPAEQTVVTQPHQSIDNKNRKTGGETDLKPLKMSAVASAPTVVAVKDIHQIDQQYVAQARVIKRTQYANESGDNIHEDSEEEEEYIAEVKRQRK